MRPCACIAPADAPLCMADGSSRSFAVLGGVPRDPQWYGGVGGMLEGLYNQPDLSQYVYDYCRNSLAGLVVTAPLPPDLTSPLPLNLDGGTIVNNNGTLSYLHPFPSYVSYVANQQFLPGHPNVTTASVQAWCCASVECNTADVPKPSPPLPPVAVPSPKGDAVIRPRRNMALATLVGGLLLLLLLA